MMHKMNTSMSPLKGETYGTPHHFQDCKDDTWVLLLNVLRSFLNPRNPNPSS